MVFPRLQTLFKSQRRRARRKENTWAFVGNYQVGNEDTKALQAYADFEKSLAEKYGKDGKFNLNAIPSQDFKKLQDLLMEWQKVNKKYEKANKELDRFYKEESL